MKSVVKKIKDQSTAFLKSLSGKDLTTHTASITFFLVFSALPLLILISLFLPLTGYGPEELIDFVTGATPDFLDGLTAQVIRETYARSGQVVPITVIIVIWSAMQAVRALITGLHMVYEIPEKKNVLFQNLTAAITVFAISFFLILSTVGLVLLNTLFEITGADRIQVTVFQAWILNFRYTITFVFSTLLLLLLYTFISGAQRRMRSHLPGALLSAVVIAIFTGIFSVYVRYNTSYVTIYGSLATFIIMLLWAYACVFIVLLGGCFNHFLIRRKQQRGKSDEAAS